jgi:hypothetical protein
MKKGSSARHRAITDSQRGATVPQAGRIAREVRQPSGELPAVRGSGELTLGGLADRGLTLAALYDTGVLERLRLAVRVRLIADLTQSLAWLHANPRLMSSHRHLLITPSTIVIGLDGVARVDVRAAKKQVSERGELEADYLAPEVLAGDPAADHRADIFSIGVLAWEALAGRRLADASLADEASRPRARAGEARQEIPSDLPPTFAAGVRTDLEPSTRRKTAARPGAKSSQSRLKTVPPLSLPDDAEWAMPFAELALQAMSADASLRPQDCRGLVQQLEMLDASRLASHQEIAEVIQGISAVATLCEPEPTLPATDSSCQVDAAELLPEWSTAEPCSGAALETCVERRMPSPRRVPEPASTRAATSSLALPARTTLTSPHSRSNAGGVRRPGAGYSARVWWVAGFVWLLVLGSLAGYVASVLAVR